MENQNTKIKFYVRRTFGEKVNATFDFVKQNWKPLLKYLTYFMLPISIIQAFYVNNSMDEMILAIMNPSASEPALADIGFGFASSLISIVASLLYIAILYGLMQLYNSRPDGLQYITFADLKPYLGHNMLRNLLAMLFMFLVIFVSAMIAFLLAMGIGGSLAMGIVGFLFILMLFILLIPISLVVPIVIFEKISIWRAYVKSLQIGFPVWGGTFGIIIVLSIVVFVIASVLSLPWGVMAVVDNMLTISDTTTAGTAVGSVGKNLLAMIAIFGTYLASIFFYIGMAYQYAHANEKSNSISVVEEIENFENL